MRTFSLPDQTGQAGKFLQTDGQNVSWATAGGGGSGTVTSIAPGSGLRSTPNPITTTGTISLDTASSNTWVAALGTFFQLNSLGAVPTSAVGIQNVASASAGIPIQISPYLEFRAHMWQTNAGGSDHTGTFRMYMIPTSGTAGGTQAGVWQLDSSKDGVYTLGILKVNQFGLVTSASGFTATTGSISSSQGSVNAFSQVTAGTEVVIGQNGTFAGKLWLLGGTSGTFDIKAPAVITSYELTVPDAQGAFGTTFQNNGSGVLSWGKSIITVSVPVSSAEIINLNSTPKQLVPAPGAGKIIEIVSIVVKYNFVSFAYVANTTLRAYQIAGSSLAENMQSLADTASTLRPMFFNYGSGAAGEYADNTPLMLDVATGNPALGDGDIVVTVNYIITTP